MEKNILKNYKDEKRFLSYFQIQVAEPGIYEIYEIQERQHGWTSNTH